MKPQSVSTSLERMQKSRRETNHAYSRARNAAEREVVHLMIDKYPTVYEAYKKAVEDDAAGVDRAIRQSRIRSACAAWYRQEHCPEWTELLDRAIAEQTADTDVVIRRRKTC